MASDGEVKNSGRSGVKGDALERFLDASQILVADPSSASCVRLVSVLCQLGAKRHRVDLAQDWETAVRLIEEKKPGVVFCEYQLGSKPGLDLLQELRGMYPEKPTPLFILITGNTSQAAVAEAAEEDVDTFILKPYSLVTLKKSLGLAVDVKFNPSEYLKGVAKGKDLLVENRLDEAESALLEACALNAKPTLAFFYLGQVRNMKRMLEEARGNYREGLDLNRIHYKCLVGLFELLTKQGKSDEAYEVVKRIAQYFPANPKRLTSVLRLAIVTKNYEDIENYYRLFTLIERRTAELVSYMCAALIVTGRYYLTRKTQSRAISVLESAAVSCAGTTKFLRFIIEVLAEYRLLKEAREILKRFPASTHASQDFVASAFLVESDSPNRSQVVQQGREALRLGVRFPSTHFALAQALIGAGLVEPARDLIGEALQAWPDQTERFHGLLHDALGDSESPQSA